MKMESPQKATPAAANVAPDLDRGVKAILEDYLAVKAGESVLITADTATDPAAMQAIFRGVRALGAHPSLLTFPQIPYQGGLADPYVPTTLEPATKHCDVWLDLTFPYLAGSHVFEQMIAAKKVRYLLGGDMGAGGIARLFGAVDMDSFYAVFEKLQKLFFESVGKPCRITDPKGTDVSFQIAKPGYLKPRRGDQPGGWLVPGACTMFPELESVKGTICFSGVFHEYFAPLPDPLVLEVDGKIRKVSGPTSHRLTLDRSLRRAGNGDYGNIIHFTHGMIPSARANGTSFIEEMRVMGADAVGMGLPWWVPGGGENHPDGIIHDQSMWIDGVRIVEDGVIVGPPDIAAIAHTLIPAVPGAAAA
jgi:2,5-dihydroxypyridine 5,6-dioxygenase